MQPDDRRERQRSRDGKDERSTLMAPPTEPHDSGNERDPEEKPEPACDRRWQTEVESHHVQRVRVLAHEVVESLEQVRVVDEPREADSCPRQEQQAGTDDAGEDGAPHPPGRGEPHDERPQEELGSQRDPDARRRVHATIPEPPGDGAREREPERQVARLNRRDDRRPHDRDAVTAPVAYAEHVQHAETPLRPGARHEKQSGRPDWKKGERNREERGKWRIRVGPTPQVVGSPFGGYGLSPRRIASAAP